MRVIVVRTDGREEVHEIRRQDAITAIHRLIGAVACDTVNLRDGRVMLVDDNGYETECIDHGSGRLEMRPIRARKPLNAAATALYHTVCVPGTTHSIVGDVAIVRDEDFA